MKKIQTLRQTFQKRLDELLEKNNQKKEEVSLREEEIFSDLEKHNQQTEQLSEEFEKVLKKYKETDKLRKEINSRQKKIISSWKEQAEDYKEIYQEFHNFAEEWEKEVKVYLEEIKREAKKKEKFWRIICIVLGVSTFLSLLVAIICLSKNE